MPSEEGNRGGLLNLPESSRQLWEWGRPGAASLPVCCRLSQGTDLGGGS